jgi:uncharacterized protein YegP (UPF0339 family)/DNA-binding phage protein
VTAISRQQGPKDDLRELNRLYADLNAGAIGLHDAIKGMRKISRLTQAQFAAHRGISVQALKQIEQGKGNPTVETLNKIASVFGLEVGLRPKRRVALPDAKAVYSIKRGSDGLYHFTLSAPNGQTMLTSERYTSKAAVLNGIEAVRRNARDESRFVRRRSTTDAPYFVLKAANGEILGMSEFYVTESAMERGLRLAQISAEEAVIQGLKQS